MNCKNREPNSAYSIKSQVDSMAKLLSNMTHLQSNIAKKILESEQWSERKKISKMMKTNQVKQQLKNFKQLFKTFSDQCKNQWIIVHQELLQILNSIVELYQIKIGKLEAKIQQQQNQIDQMQQKSSAKSVELQKMFTQNNESDFDCKPLTEYSQQPMALSNSKKIRISDVIASYQSSILSSNGVNLDDNQPIDINLSVDHNKSVCEKSFIKGGYENSIEYSNFSKLYRKEVEEKYPLSLAESFNNYNDVRGFKGIQYQMDERQNLPSFVSSCRKLSDFQQSKRDHSKSGRLKNRQSNEANSASKLSQLRKYLYNRKKI